MPSCSSFSPRGFAVVVCPLPDGPVWRAGGGCHARRIHRRILRCCGGANDGRRGLQLPARGPFAASQHRRRFGIVHIANAAAENVELLVTEPIENVISGISAVDTLTSTSSE